jgi:hypothetical protein
MKPFPSFRNSNVDGNEVKYLGPHNYVNLVDEDIELEISEEDKVKKSKGKGRKIEDDPEKNLEVSAGKDPTLFKEIVATLNFQEWLKDCFDPKLQIGSKGLPGLANLYYSIQKKNERIVTTLRKFQSANGVSIPCLFKNFGSDYYKIDKIKPTIQDLEDMVEIDKVAIKKFEDRYSPLGLSACKVRNENETIENFLVNLPENPSNMKYADFAMDSSGIIMYNYANTVIKQNSGYSPEQVIEVKDFLANLPEPNTRPNESAKSKRVVTNFTEGQCDDWMRKKFPGKNVLERVIEKRQLVKSPNLSAYNDLHTLHTTDELMAEIPETEFFTTHQNSRNASFALIGRLANVAFATNDEVAAKSALEKLLLELLKAKDDGLTNEERALKKTAEKIRREAKKNGKEKATTKTTQETATEKSIESSSIEIEQKSAENVVTETNNMDVAEEVTEIGYPTLTQQALKRKKVLTQKKKRKARFDPMADFVDEDSPNQSVIASTDIAVEVEATAPSNQDLLKCSLKMAQNFRKENLSKLLVDSNYKVPIGTVVSVYAHEDITEETLGIVTSGIIRERKNSFFDVELYKNTMSQKINVNKILMLIPK